MKIVVFDDDPTGSQTVHSCPLLLSWDVDVLRRGLRHQSPLLFVLANTRSLVPDEAANRITEICNALNQAIAAEDLSFENIILVSRGDSTLRGHGVLEPEVINNSLGPFDATLHVPAFLEGGRTTVDGMHLLNGTPVHKTSFAKDHLFTFSTSYLPDWLHEKSRGAIDPLSVQRITLSQLDQAALSPNGMIDLERSLKALVGNQPVVVDAVKREQLDVLATAVRNLSSSKRFLFRSAASLLNSLADLSPKSLDPKQIRGFCRKDEMGQYLPGMILVGSHVELADIQLRRLLEVDKCKGIELPVAKLASLFNEGFKDLHLPTLEKQWVTQLEELLEQGKTPVLYTTRGEILFSSVRSRLLFGYYLADLMARLTKNIAPKLGYLISKGGITTHILLQKGLGLEKVNLAGQILPGLSLVIAGARNNNSPLPIVTFPGNLGGKNTLLQAWEILNIC